MPITCKLEITPSNKDGTPIGDTVCKDNDMFTNNFGLFLQALFKPYDTSLGNANMKDTGGNPQYAAVWYTNDSRGFNATDQPNPAGVYAGFTVGVGIGGAAPTRYDTNLDSQAPGTTWLTVTMPQAIWLSGSGVIKFSGLVFMPTTQTITEAGLAIRVYDSTFLLARDTFTGVVINGGTYANITYTIQL